MSDADNTPFWIERWKPQEWESFKRGAVKQAVLWDRQFFLKPPATFTEGDITHAGGRASVWRPYIDCMFSVTFTDVPGANRSIEVAKLNIDYARYKARQATLLGTPVFLDASGGTFRSTSMLWDSFDLTPKVGFSLDFKGGISDGVLQPVIAHELGHALGLTHIGVLKKAPLCTIARRLGWPDAGTGTLTDMFVGGMNAPVCYGQWYGNGTLYDDIMGGGATFSEVDGLPWVWAMQQLRNRPEESWQVLLQSQSSETGSFVSK